VDQLIKSEKKNSDKIGIDVGLDSCLYKGDEETSYKRPTQGLTEAKKK